MPFMLFISHTARLFRHVNCYTDCLPGYNGLRMMLDDAVQCACYHSIMTSPSCALRMHHRMAAARRPEGPQGRLACEHNHQTTQLLGNDKTFREVAHCCNRACDSAEHQPVVAANRPCQHRRHTCHELLHSSPPASTFVHMLVAWLTRVCVRAASCDLSAPRVWYCVVCSVES